MEFKDNIPIYLQIKQYLYRQIITGKLQPGSKIPSVRELAVLLTVNVNTVQRALQQMNTEGILFTKRGEGNFVTEDTKLLKKTKQELIEEELDKFVDNMAALGLTNKEITISLTRYLNRE
ncbi:MULTISPECIES: GntR family transcriptional regulator [unclassified Lactobacillus]|uniref:GntR family transcriptional regulator n=1 Tax=unclassified Lactobacillus TaxID=2620435 RepID=UPI000EFC1BE7|nr:MULTISPECIES: GntR family transcriptional regulator [unclassified Lactobacillus]RMC24336.1 GntR family transcriptional regulator [Lactobacillus sp. ESL0247]RMC28475.1 GntR family transcriptional regulator [Lactobacillus sp. ESL0246]RMC31666.1 GntR family transcriptional regulator [Lactobacillus sp. ESL0245]